MKITKLFVLSALLLTGNSVAKADVADGDDMTSLLKNPDFEQGREGWTIDAVGGGNVVTGGTRTNTCFEAWNNASFDVYQIVENAPKGIYEISVQGFYRYGRGRYSDYLAQEIDAVKPGKAPVYVYMNDNQTSLTNIYGDPRQIDNADFYAGSEDFSLETDNNGKGWYFPNGMASAAIAFSDGMYTQSAFGLVANEGDVMRIGVKGNSSQLNDSWSIWDNFKLTFRGFDNVEVILPILERTMTTSESMVESLMSKSARAGLLEAIRNADIAISTGKGETMFNALSALLTANAVANKSIALYMELIVASNNLAAAIDASAADEAVIAEASAFLDVVSQKLTNGEIEEAGEAEWIRAEIDAMIKKLRIPKEMNNASDSNPFDCTFIIENPDYTDNNNYGWSGDVNFAVGYNVAEVWNSNFDVYQVLEGLPKGTYTLSVQGFYRYGTNNNEYTTYRENPAANNHLSLYALVGDEEYTATMPRLARDGVEEHTSTAKDNNGYFVAGDDFVEAWMWAWLADPEVNADSTAATGLRIVNGMGTAALAFEQGKFDGTTVVFKVGDDGKARIGLKKYEEYNTFDCWSIWDNWKLTYYGPNSLVTDIKDAAGNAAVVKTEYFNVSGARINSAAKGIVIVKETLGNGTVKVKKVTVK